MTDINKMYDIHRRYVRSRRLLLFTLGLVAVFLVSYFMFGLRDYFPGAPHSAAKNAVAESLEHKFARETLEGLVQVQRFRRSETNSEEYKRTQEQIEVLTKTLPHVDDCVTIYRRTSDRKLAALAPIEKGQVQECQGMDLYPPKTR